MRKRGEGRIFQRGSVYWIQYQNGRGKQIRETTRSTNERDAVRALRKALGKVESGIEPDTKSLRYEYLRDILLLDYSNNKRKSLRRDKAGEPYLDKVNRLTEFFAGERVSNITTESLNQFIEDQQKKGRSSATINRSLSALRRALNLARKARRVQFLPYFPMLKEPPARSGFFERQEYDRLSRELPDYLRPVLAIGFFSGMRLGEVLRLEWSQVDFLRSRIQLRAGETKNGEGRTVPIVPELLGILVERFGKRSPECPCVCFVADRKGRHARINSFRKAWQSACVRAELGRMIPNPDETAKTKVIYEGKNFHDTRRTAVRDLIRSGVPRSVAKKISGHKTDAVFERYNIVDEADVINAGEKLAQYHQHKLGANSGTISENAAVNKQLTN